MGKPELTQLKNRANELFKAGLRVRDLNLKSILVLILFVHKLRIESSKYNRENYPRKCFFEHKKEKPGLNLTPG